MERFVKCRESFDLRDVPLVSRRAALKELLAERGADRIRFSEAFDASAAQLLDAACKLGLEGVMLKRAGSTYVSARSETWLKLKCQQRQEFVVIGFTDRSGASDEAGGLLLAYHEDGVLRYAGSVGTGWSNSAGRDLHTKLVKLQVDQPAVEPSTVKPGRGSKRTPGTERWVKTQMVVEVAFSEWTSDGHVRHPTFRGVRSDTKSRSSRSSLLSNHRAVEPPLGGAKNSRAVAHDRAGAPRDCFGLLLDASAVAQSSIRQARAHRSFE
jgi:bifunctional non-homologous end joining protein LigD